MVVPSYERDSWLAGDLDIATSPDLEAKKKLCETFSDG